MKMIINGKKADSLSGKTFEVTAPSTGEVIDLVPLAAEEDIKLAIDAAVAGQKVWADYPIYERANIVYRFLDLVEANKESLAQTLSKENGKPIREARAEIGNIRIGFSAFAEYAKHYYGKTIPPGTEPGQQNNFQIVTREPIGVVAAIIPFNFPCDLFDKRWLPQS